jgi:hypothetical protein
VKSRYGRQLEFGLFPVPNADDLDLLRALATRADELGLDVYVFRPLDGVDAHHNVARFRWELVPAEGGEPVAIGFDVAITDGDGRLGRVIGFLDKAPA